MILDPRLRGDRGKSKNGTANTRKNWWSKRGGLRYLRYVRLENRKKRLKVKTALGKFHTSFAGLVQSLAFNDSEYLENVPDTLIYLHSYFVSGELFFFFCELESAA